MTCEARHCGTVHGYRHYGCRCLAARRANSIEHQRYLMRRAHEGMLLVDATGSRRRIQALAALGWPYRRIAEVGGFESAQVYTLTRATVVHKDTAAKVAAVYDRLSMQVPRPSSSTTRARKAAARKGWLPPLAWDDETIDDPAAEPAMAESEDIVDEVAVQRALSGDRPDTLHRAELIETIHVAHSRGLDDRQIAARLGMKPTTVQRIRARAKGSAA
jgi:hypothetical protein